MEAPLETFGTIEITDSIEAVEYDVARELFHATFDSDRDSAGLAVIAVVATVANRPPEKLAPLHSIIDTDALQNLFRKLTKGSERRGRVTFSYEGFEVTVFSEGRIEVDQVRGEGHDPGGVAS